MRGKKHSKLQKVAQKTLKIAKNAKYCQIAKMQKFAKNRGAIFRMDR